MKTTKKTTKKAVKPTYTVDLTTAKDGGDVLYAFVVAKVNAGVPITTDEFEYALTREKESAIVATLDKVYDDVITVVNEVLTAECVCYTCKKKPWYKRLWNWIRRK